MKLDIDLNKLSLKELEIVLDMAKKQAKEPDKEETSIVTETIKPIKSNARKQRKYNWKEILPQMKEYVLSKKGKKVHMIKLMRKFKIRCVAGQNYQVVKRYLVNCKELEQIAKTRFAAKKHEKNKSAYVPVTVDKRIARMKYMSARMNQLMKQDVTMSREKAACISSQEWAAHKPLGKIKEEKKDFNWSQISNTHAAEVRQIVLHQLKTTQCIERSDFDCLRFDDDGDFYHFAQKILVHEDEILSDLGLEGKIVWDNIMLVFYKKGE